MPHTLKIATWNAGHREDAWRLLDSLDAEIVLAQELPAPPAGHADRTIYRPFAVGTNRTWGTAVWARSLPVRALPITTSDTDQTREGVAAVAEIDLPTGGVLTAISLHAIDERIRPQVIGSTTQHAGKGFAVTTMHRVLSDLTGYLDDSVPTVRDRKSGTRQARSAVVLGGDLNCSPGWDIKQNNPSHELVFARIAAFGLTPTLPVLPDATHATFIRERGGKMVSAPQIDHLFTSGGATVTDSAIVNLPQFVARRDHLPVLSTIEL